MPPIKKFTKEYIINAAYEIVRLEGIDSLNARNLASKLESSVQPIFHNFKSMDEVKREVYKKIYDTYKEYMLSGSTLDKAYKQMGLAYIRFARDYKEFFKIIFMQKSDLEAVDFIMNDAIGDTVIKKGQILSELPYDEQKDFHVRVWIFTHGLACLVATETIQISDEEIDEILESTVRFMLIGYKEKKNEKSN